MQKSGKPRQECKPSIANTSYDDTGIHFTKLNEIHVVGKFSHTLHIFLSFIIFHVCLPNPCRIPRGFRTKRLGLLVVFTIFKSIFSLTLVHKVWGRPLLKLGYEEGEAWGRVWPKWVGGPRPDPLVKSTKYFTFLKYVSPCAKQLLRVHVKYI